MENNDLGKNRETFKIEKSIKKIESIYKNWKNNYKVLWYWNWKTKI